MNDITLGILVSLVGLWIPFLIWDRTGKDNEDKWYAIPLLLTIYLAGVGTFVLGVYIVVRRFL